MDQCFDPTESNKFRGFAVLPDYFSITWLKNAHQPGSIPPDACAKTIPGAR